MTRPTSYFNSRPCERGDSRSLFRYQNSAIFQFPPLREGRRAGPDGYVAGYSDFNSRPCERGDVHCKIHIAMQIYFNSRPCERGDNMLFSTIETFNISIPAPARGATFRAYALRNPRNISIPAPARGATRQIPQQTHRRCISIPAPARGATLLTE